jgi:hypothetical protein
MHSKYYKLQWIMIPFMAKQGALNLAKTEPLLAVMPLLSQSPLNLHDIIYGVITNDIISVYINLLIRIAHIICNHPLLSASLHSTISNGPFQPTTTVKKGSYKLF